MIKDFTDDTKMAELGRYYATTKAIRKAKEGIREVAVTVLNGRANADELKEFKRTIDDLFNELIDAVGLLAGHSTGSAQRQATQSNEQDI